MSSSSSLLRASQEKSLSSLRESVGLNNAVIVHHDSGVAGLYQVRHFEIDRSESDPQTAFELSVVAYVDPQLKRTSNVGGVERNDPPILPEMSFVYQKGQSRTARYSMPAHEYDKYQNTHQAQFAFEEALSIKRASVKEQKTYHDLFSEHKRRVVTPMSKLLGDMKARAQEPFKVYHGMSIDGLCSSLSIQVKDGEPKPPSNDLIYDLAKKVHQKGGTLGDFVDLVSHASAFGVRDRRVAEPLFQVKDELEGLRLIGSPPEVKVDLLNDETTKRPLPALSVEVDNVHPKRRF